MADTWKMEKDDYVVKRADSPELLEKTFEIRREVFVVEQHVPPEDEFDEFEEASRHFVALDSNQNPIGSARWRATDKGIKLERFTVKKSRRGKGIGAALVQAVLNDISEQKGSGNYLYMHAQLDAMPLYAKFGFEHKGEMFEECNIKHFTMWKRN
jgi:predicted GNAT family N-acyltransferase